MSTLNTKLALSHGLTNGFKFLPQYFLLQILSFFSMVITTAFIFLLYSFINIVATINYLSLIPLLFLPAPILVIIFFLGVNLKFTSNYSQINPEKFKSIFNIKGSQIFKAFLVYLKISIPSILGLLIFSTTIFLQLSSEIFQIINNPFLLLYGPLELFTTVNPIPLILGAAAIFIGYIISIVWFFKYSLGAFYIIDQNPTYKESIQKCNQLMKGNKFKLFLILFAASLISMLLLMLIGIVSGMFTEINFLLVIIGGLITLLVSIYTNNFLALTFGNCYHQIFNSNDQNNTEPPKPAPPTPSLNQPQSAPTPEQPTTPIIPALADLEKAKQNFDNQATNTPPAPTAQQSPSKTVTPPL